MLDWDGDGRCLEMFRRWKKAVHVMFGVVCCASCGGGVLEKVQRRNISVTEYQSGRVALVRVERSAIQSSLKVHTK